MITLRNAQALEIVARFPNAFLQGNSDNFSLRGNARRERSFVGCEGWRGREGGKATESRGLLAFTRFRSMMIVEGINQRLENGNGYWKAGREAFITRKGYRGHTRMHRARSKGSPNSSTGLNLIARIGGTCAFSISPPFLFSLFFFFLFFFFYRYYLRRFIS